MTNHLTVRMAWHDNNWNGRVCNNPEDNFYCVGTHSLLSERIARKRDLEIEKNHAGEDIKNLKGYIPPCYWSINAFCNEEKNIKHEHPFDFVTVDSIPETLGPFSVFSWPFKLSFVITKKNRNKHGKYWPKSVLKDRINDFLDKFVDKESIVFFYCNYDNPVSADDSESKPKYLLLGCALLAKKGEPTFFKFSPKEFERIKRGEGMQNFPDMNWVLQFSYDFENYGVLLPYKQYLENEKNNPDDSRLKEMKVLIDEPSLVSGFKYVAMDIDDDKCLYLLYKIKKAIEKVQSDGIVVDRDFSKEEKTIDYLIEKTWNNRGLYPSLKNIIDIFLGVKDDEESVGAKIMDRLEKNTTKETEILKVFFELISNKRKNVPKYLDEFESEIKHLQIEMGSANFELLKKLSLFCLTKYQLNNLIFKRKEWFKKEISDLAIINNPYLIAEAYSFDEKEDYRDAPDLVDEPIDVFKIDIGLFPDRKYLERDFDLQNMRIDSPQRLRAVIIKYLYEIGENQGHCYCDSKELFNHIINQPLFYKEEMKVSDNVLETDKGEYFEHFKQRLTVKLNENKYFYYLIETLEAEKIIREVVVKLISRPDYKTNTDHLKTYIIQQKDELLQKQIPNFGANKFLEERSFLFNNVFKKSFFIISGNPGSGKTFALDKVVKEIKSQNETVRLFAPTGKATLRLSEKTSEKAETIDMLITREGYEDFLKDPENLVLKKDGEKITIQNLIIDECSMIDLFKMATLFSMINLDKLKRIILIGDENQLPPIGFGKPFFDIIEYVNNKKELSTPNYIKLITNCRQENDATILNLAGIFAEKKRYYEPLLEKLKNEGKISTGFDILKWRDKEELNTKINEKLDEIIGIELGQKGRDPKGMDSQTQLNVLFNLYDNGYVNNKNFDFPKTLKLDIFQIISPYRAGFFGTLGINEFIQSKYRQEDNYFRESAFYHSDKIINRKNIYQWNNATRRPEIQISNGSIGIVNNVHNGWSRKYYFPEHSFPIKKIDDEDNFELAYAITIHKSQGSDFKNVFMVLSNKHTLLSKELVYTALTRSTHRLTLFLQESKGENALEIARKISFVMQRNTSIFKEPEDNKTKYEPRKGISVRSKVEYIIFKALEARGLDFKYEDALALKNRSYRIHPDFIIKLTNNRIVYWEHLGMLDLKEYSEDWLLRKKDYEEHGLFANVITTDDLDGIKNEVVEKIIDDIVSNNLKNTPDSKFSNHHYELYSKQAS